MDQKSFYTRLDPSSLRDGVDKKRYLAYELLGRGADFATYGLPGEPLLVLKIASDDFVKKRCQLSGSSHWPSLMARLSTLRHPLIPPFYLGKGEEKWFYVMPRGLASEVLEEDLNACLREHGMVLGDAFQGIKTPKGQVFIGDWSDLQPLATA